MLFEWAHILVLIILSFEYLLICISNLGERRKPEEDDQQNNEAGRSEVGPLNVLQPSICVHGVGKEDSRDQERSDESPNTLNCLSQVQSNLAVLGGSVDRKESVKWVW